MNKYGIGNGTHSHLLCIVEDMLFVKMIYWIYFQVKLQYLKFNMFIATHEGSRKFNISLSKKYLWMNEFCQEILSV